MKAGADLQYLRVFQKRSMYFKLLLFITAIILVTVLFISSVTYTISANNSFDNAKVYNRAILAQQRDLMTKELTAIKNLAVNVMVTQSYLYSTRNNGLTAASLIDLSRYLEQQKNLNPYIDSIYLYYEDLQLVLSSSAETRTSRIETFADSDWLSYVHDNTAARIIWLANRSLENKGKAITVLQKMPWVGSTDGAVLVNLDQRKLFDDIFGHYHNKMGSMLVLDQHNQLLYTEADPASASLPAQGLTQLFAKEEDSFVDENRNIVTYTTSALNGWKFINVTPQSALLQKMNHIKYIVLGISAFYISVAVVISFYISRRLYHPLKAAIAHIGSWGDRKTKPAALDEASFIRQAFDQMTTRNVRLLQEKDSIQHTLDEHRGALKEKYVNDLISGHTAFAPNRQTEAYIGLFGLNLHAGGYSVLTAEWEDADAFVRQHDKMSFVLVKYKLVETLKAAIDGEVFLKDDDKIVVIANLRSHPRETATELARFVQTTIETHDGIGVSVGVSNAHEGLERLETAYGETIEALRHRMYFGRGEILAYRSVAHWSGQQSEYYYPYELEKKLIQSIKQADGEEASRIVAEIVQVAIAKKLGKTNVQQLFFQLSGEIMKSIAQSGGDVKAVLGEPFDYLQTISLSNTLQSIESCLSAICRTIAAYYNDKRMRINDDTLELAIAFMQANYNNNITIDTVAEHVHLSSSYLGRIFKEMTGTTLNEYLIGIRIREACALLDRSDASVEDICLRVGYTNVSYFNKLFKARTGQTPGHYRRNRASRASLQQE
ncbi:MAG: helix-turn-helix domain-containing protein [Paenibacillaceae bacterium]|nr:helix-turn-helix domain-containing protein [Paenibacillaceae bacterium]